MRVLENPVVTETQMIDALRDAFRPLATGEATPAPQFTVDLPGGADVIHYPAVLPAAGVYAVKVSPYLPHPGRPAVVTAWTLLMSLDDGSPIALVNAHGLTVERTAAATALAVDRLAAPDAKTASVVGWGRLGRAHARYLRHLRPDITVTATSRSGKGSDEGATRYLAGLDAAAEGADAVLLCTSAADSVLDPRLLHPGSVVTSISTNVPGAREIPVDAVAELDVYVDSRTSTTVATELKDAARRGWDAGAVRGDLAELLAGTAQPRQTDRVAYFRSVGLGIEDAAAALAALRAAS